MTARFMLHTSKDGRFEWVGLVPVVVDQVAGVQVVVDLVAGTQVAFKGRELSWWIKWQELRWWIKWRGLR